MIASQASLSSSVRYVKGVGPHRMAQLAQLGIATVEDACYYPPRRYEDRTRLIAIRDLIPGEICTIRGRVTAVALRRIRRGQTLVEAAIEDETGVLSALWFNQPYLAQQLKAEDTVILYGRVEPGARFQMIHPEHERVEEDDAESVHTGRIVPIYPLTAGIGQRWLRQTIAAILERYAGQLDDPLPGSLCRDRGWPALPEAVRELHFPSSQEALERARMRLIFQELLLLQVGLAQRRQQVVALIKPHRYQIDGPVTRGVEAGLPFTLTDSQRQVLEQLTADLRAPWPMHRLLQGDVGCGKTIVMIHLMAIAAQSGCQVALMAPTELLAEQHVRVVRRYLDPLRVPVVLLSQGVAAGERRRLAKAVAGGEAAVVIGTHALLQQGLVFKRLSLVMIDEQHKFGVVQRAQLAKKGRTPDVLVVTATPIPRTLALTRYGDLEVSTIAQLPAGRGRIETRWMRGADRAALYGLVREQLTQRRQGYVVYPLVEEGVSREVRAATAMARHLQVEVFPRFRIGLLHGQMPAARKEATMQAFARGEIDLLVSTVIVEVGLDVPNATVMVIEHPDRFGLAQLHQLRGRIGRGPQPSWCVVVSDAGEESVRQRLTAFVETLDGFQLAEKDLELRGPGELRGSRQSGELRLRIADLMRDRALLELARQEAGALVSRDPALRDPSLAALRRHLRAR